MTSINKNRIALNTLLLYVRMIFITVIALFTSRVLLNSLGIEDYGIYNIVAGVVVLFSFLNTAMTSATQRFITYSLGKNDLIKSNEVFITSVLLHSMIAIVLVIFSETLGMVIFKGLINIPEDRVSTSKIVYQFSILTTVFHVLAVPYISTIIAYEKLRIFALISIVDAILKFTVAYSTKYSFGDGLILYSVLLSVASFVTLFLYYIVCKKKFDICKIRLLFDKNMFKKMLSFSGWSLLGQFSVVTADQGTNILLNKFFSVALNSTMGVTNQVNNAVNNLVSSFQTAFQPQITKSYANSEFKEMNLLMQKASKISYFLLLIVCIPLIANIDNILLIWLKVVPDYCGIFCSLLLIATLINSISGPLWMSIFASGNIRYYQVLLSIIYFLQVPVLFFCFYKGLPPFFAVIIKILAAFFILCLRLYFNNKNVEGFEISEFLKSVIYPLIISTILITLIIVPMRYFYYKTGGILMWFVVEFLSFIICLVIIYIFGFKLEEREPLKKLVLDKIKRI